MRDWQPSMLKNGEPASFSGLVTRIVFRNDQNGYSILDIEGQAGEWTVTGVMPHIMAGDMVSGEGSWRDHPTYGPQIAVRQISRDEPHESERIEKYLASGAIKGIGEATARKLVEAFGDDTLTVMRNNPERIAKIRGIGRVRAESFSRQLKADRAYQDLSLFLLPHGIGPARIHRIYSIFGMTAETLIKENPFILAERVPGIGFQTADRLAVELGFGGDHPARLKGAVLFAMNQSLFRNGNTVIHEDSVASFLSERLGVAEEEREEAAVRAELTMELAEYLEVLKANFVAVSFLDFRLARAVLADHWSAGKPSLLEEGEGAVLENMSHPIVEDDLRKRGATFVRQSISLLPGTTVLSGPNMGGKSVALKSMTLALVLIQLGYYPPATASATPLYDFISYSSDHLDTTKRGLSSFGQEIVRIRDDAARARRERGLVVMDEPCRGTNPEEATALVGALARFYGKQRGSFVMSTHYRVPDGEGIAHVRIRGIQSEALEAISENDIPRSDRDAIRGIEALMDYRLERVDGDVPVPTDAIRIAKLLGLDRDILKLIDHFNGESELPTE